MTRQQLPSINTASTQHRQENGGRICLETATQEEAAAKGLLLRKMLGGTLLDRMLSALAPRNERAKPIESEGA